MSTGASRKNDQKMQRSRGAVSWQREDKAMIRSSYLATALVALPLAFGGAA